MNRIPTSNTDLVVDESRAAVQRSRMRRSGGTTPAVRHRRAMRARRIRGKAARIATFWALLFFAALTFSLLAPGGLGITGVIVTPLLAMIGTLLLLIYPKARQVTPEGLLESDIGALPANAHIWLENQRAALPAPAQTPIDGIGVQLETLSAQLATMEASSPATDEVRRLVGEHLPDLVNGYMRVPAAMRGRPMSGGTTPDQELVDGLQIIERRIGQMSEDIARGDLDALATRGRFLEIKYQEE